MRSEKRNRFLAVLMALVLLAAVPAVYLRVQLAGDQVTGRDLKALVDYNTAYLDSAGNVITDNATPVPAVVGNLLGFDGYVSDALTTNYGNQAVSHTAFNRITGIRSLKDAEGCRVQTTLLPLASQQALADGFRDETGYTYNGAVFAYNYKTGQVHTALSLPSAGRYGEDLPDGALYNKVLKGVYVPGSTMKIVALLCALEHPDMDPEEFTFNCDGRTELPDGSTVDCGYAHGVGLNIVDAIGMSCNGYITQMASQFDVEQACGILQRFGFSTQLFDTPARHVGQLPRSSSSTVFQDPDGFSDRWAFAGQGATQVSCVDMAMIAGAIANEGQAAEPYLVQQVVDMDNGTVPYGAQTVLRKVATPEAANSADRIWTKACHAYYNLPDSISYAKTGTAQHHHGGTSRSYLGVMKEYDTAFYIYVEGLRSGDPRCAKIAGILASELEKYY